MYDEKEILIMENLFIVFVLNIALLVLQIVTFIYAHKNSEKKIKLLNLSIIILAFGSKIIPLLIENIIIT